MKQVFTEDEVTAIMDYLEGLYLDNKVLMSAIRTVLVRGKIDKEDAAVFSKAIEEIQGYRDSSAFRKILGVSTQ